MKKKIIWFVSAIFWVSMFVIAKKVRFQWKENPYLVSILLLGLLIHLFWYQSKLSKLKKQKQKIKLENTEILKKEIILQLDPNSFPKGLAHLCQISEKWGVENSLLRENLYEKSHNDELWELKDNIESSKKLIEDYLKQPNDSIEFNSLQLTFQAYNDLGLWTWSNK